MTLVVPVPRAQDYSFVGTELAFLCKLPIVFKYSGTVPTYLSNMLPFFSYLDKSVSMSEFISEWEGRLESALAAGCQYSDAVLAFKLIHNSHLDTSEIQQSKLRNLTYP